jgi:hypothetical protein
MNNIKYNKYIRLESPHFGNQMRSNMGERQAPDSPRRQVGSEVINNGNEIINSNNYECLPGKQINHMNQDNTQNNINVYSNRNDNSAFRGDYGNSQQDMGGHANHYQPNRQGYTLPSPKSMQNYHYDNNYLNSGGYNNVPSYNNGYSQQQQQQPYGTNNGYNSYYNTNINQRDNSRHSPSNERLRMAGNNIIK